MEHKFKKGDRVKIRATTGSARDVWEIGEIGTVRECINMIAVVKNEKHQGDGIENAFFHYQIELVAANAKTITTLPVKFILQYDIGGDPFETFATEKELRKRIAELAEKPDLRRDSLVVYDVKRTRKVSLGVKIIIK